MDKDQIRRGNRARRRQQPCPDDGPALAQQLQQLLGALQVGPGATLAGFVPARGEPDVRNGMTDAWERGDAVLVPRTLPECQLEWVRWSPSAALAPDRHGLQSPLGAGVAGALRGPAVVMLIPALAVDQHGTRLGNGAGYYDRALAGLRRWPLGPLRVAVVHPREVSAEPLPIDPHDEAVDVVLTRDGWSRVGDDPGGAREGAP